MVTRLRTVMDLIALARGHLANAGIESPRLDAEVLLGHVLGLDRLHLYVQHDRPVTPQEVDAYRECIARRARHEPVSYITGAKEFYSLEFMVDPRVLIPRPETEHLVEAVQRELNDRRSSGLVEDGTTSPTGKSTRVADVGTGSGAVAVALAANDATLEVVATDVSVGALEVAKENIDRHGLAERITLRHGDLFHAFAPGDPPFDAIVSNPPYIDRSGWESLDSNVKDYEPKEALIGGETGLEVIERLAFDAANYLKPTGFLAFEFGAGQSDQVRQMAKRHGYAYVRIDQDLAGIDRVAVLAKELPK